MSANRINLVTNDSTSEYRKSEQQNTRSRVQNLDTLISNINSSSKKYSEIVLNEETENAIQSVKELSLKRKAEYSEEYNGKKKFKSQPCKHSIYVTITQVGYKGINGTIMGYFPGISLRGFYDPNIVHEDTSRIHVSTESKELMLNPSEVFYNDIILKDGTFAQFVSEGNKKGQFIVNLSDIGKQNRVKTIDSNSVKDEFDNKIITTIDGNMYNLIEKTDTTYTVSEINTVVSTKDILKFNKGFSITKNIEYPNIDVLKWYTKVSAIGVPEKVLVEIKKSELGDKTGYILASNEKVYKILQFFPTYVVIKVDDPTDIYINGHNGKPMTIYDVKGKQKASDSDSDSDSDSSSSSDTDSVYSNVVDADDGGYLSDSSFGSIESNFFDNGPEQVMAFNHSNQVSSMGKKDSNSKEAQETEKERQLSKEKRKYNHILRALGINDTIEYNQSIQNQYKEYESKIEPVNTEYLYAFIIYSNLDPVTRMPFREYILKTNPKWSRKIPLLKRLYENLKLPVNNQSEMYIRPDKYQFPKLKSMELLKTEKYARNSNLTSSKDNLFIRKSKRSSAVDVEYIRPNISYPLPLLHGTDLPKTEKEIVIKNKYTESAINDILKNPNNSYSQELLANIKRLPYYIEENPQDSEAKTLLEDLVTAKRLKSIWGNFNYYSILQVIDFTKNYYTGIQDNDSMETQDIGLKTIPNISNASSRELENIVIKHVMTLPLYIQKIKYSYNQVQIAQLQQLVEQMKQAME
jgi:hypothetical protein